MSDNQNPDPDDQAPETNAGLREAARLGKEAQARAEALARENLFLRAGVDLDNKVGQMLYKTWDGNDIDALKAEASELGVTVGTRPVFTPEEAQQQQFRQTLTGPPPVMTTQETPHPTETAVRQFHEDRKKGIPLETAQLAAFDRVFAAAASGDKRAIFDPVAYANEASQYGHGRPRG
jgi:hypothetical protein